MTSRPSETPRRAARDAGRVIPPPKNAAESNSGAGAPVGVPPPDPPPAKAKPVESRSTP